MSQVGSLSLGITVGTECNFRCRHCLVDERLGNKKISRIEIQRLISEIDTHSPRAIVFTGGEPTLYLKEINAILSAIAATQKIKVKVITNGHFAVNPAAAEKTLKSFRLLNGVSVSYDKFHSEFVREAHIHNLYEACHKLGLSFSVMCAIQSPLDLTFLNKLKLSGISITTQKILPIGNAKANGLEYGYQQFEDMVLKRKCPNLGGLVYNCGFGFTVCCGFLASESDNRRYVHQTIAEHRGSPFYQLISKYSFGELLRKAGMSKKQLSPVHSSPCSLCAHIVPRILHCPQSGKIGV